MKWNFIVIFIFFFTILFIGLFLKPSNKIKENAILYNRFQIQTIIHHRLIIVKDLQTNQQYWMIRDHDWLISAPFINIKD